MLRMRAAICTYTCWQSGFSRTFSGSIASSLTNAVWRAPHAYRPVCQSFTQTVSHTHRPVVAQRVPSRQHHFPSAEAAHAAYIASQVQGMQRLMPSLVRRGTRCGRTMFASYRQGRMLETAVSYLPHLLSYINTAPSPIRRGRSSTDVRTLQNASTQRCPLWLLHLLRRLASTSLRCHHTSALDACTDRCISPRHRAYRHSRAASTEVADPARRTLSPHPV